MPLWQQLLFDKSFSGSAKTFHTLRVRTTFAVVGPFQAVSVDVLVHEWGMESRERHYIKIMILRTIVKFIAKVFLFRNLIVVNGHTHTYTQTISVFNRYKKKQRALCLVVLFSVTHWKCIFIWVVVLLLFIIFTTIGCKVSRISVQQLQKTKSKLNLI